MADNENTFLNANSIYEEVEGESGVQLTLEEDQQRNIIGTIKEYDPSVFEKVINEIAQAANVTILNISK